MDIIKYKLMVFAGQEKIQTYTLNTVLKYYLLLKIHKAIKIFDVQNALK